MGINSTSTSYGFGQLGSAFQNLAKPVYPPKDHVICAITFLAANTPTVLETETLDTKGPQYFGTNDTEATAANYLGVTEAACTGARTTVFQTNDTVTISAENTKIKVGQNVLLVNDSDTVDAGLTVDAETVTPVYNGPNATSVKVLKVNGVNITLDTVLSPTASQTLVFLDEYHGAGGTTAEGATYPAGLTIYGRWTSITPAADANGGVICYFGK
tara:strand:- start:1427 stop:2071 length:645 start_codon:yes stop_codon:yes gene_type:complete